MKKSILDNPMQGGVLCTDNATVTGLIDRIENVGLVSRDAGPPKE